MGVVTNVLMANLVLCGVFTVVYYFLHPEKDYSFNTATGKYTKLTPLYFSTVTHSSLGYGDISPKSERAKIIAMMHAFSAWLATILFTVDGICKVL